MPEAWEWTTLNGLTELIEDCPHSTAKDEGKGFALIRTPNVGEGHLILDKVHRVSKEIYDKRNARAIPQYMDIIYAREAPAGNAAMIDDKELVCLGQRTVLIRPLVNFVDSMWLTYAINSPYARTSLISKATGSTVTHVNMENIRPFVLPLPPLTEQRRIVKEIERWFSLIDIIESGKESLKTAVKQAKAKILDLVIHGKLVPQDPADEPASELLRRITPKAEITSDNAQYGKVPQGWCRCRLSSIVKIINGKSQKDVEDTNGPYHIYGSGGIIGKANQYLCEAGSTIIGRKGTINCPIFVRENFWNVDTAFGMKPIQGLSDEFYFYFCNYFDFSKLDKSTALPSLTKRDIGNIVFPLPPLAEQRRIVAKIEELFAQLDLIEAEL